MRLRKTVRFQKAYDQLSSPQQDAVDEAIRRFAENPRHPALHFEKLVSSDYRTIRVDRGRRIVLRMNQDVFELVDIGHHDFIYRKYG